MAGYVGNLAIPTNPYLQGLLTEPANPNPVRWENSAPLKIFLDDGGLRAWTDAETTAVMMAYAEWSKVANIDFVFVNSIVGADSSSILNLDENSDSLGQTTAPADDVFPNVIEFNGAGQNFATIQPGGDTYSTIVHEIGHSIGLYHPHGGTPFPGVTLNDDQGTGDNQLNQQIWTVMSYVVGWTGQPRTDLEFGTNSGPMAFDIAAVQHLYGARAAETGDNIYTLAMINQVGIGWDAIWDTGGSDTITGAGAATNLTIDLREAPLTGANAGGYVSWVNGIEGGFTIANTVVIENAIGGNANDTITGNSANNSLTGGTGNDTLDGGTGIDTAIFTGQRADYALTRTGDTITVSQVGASAVDGVDMVTNVEILEFTDRSYNLQATAKAATIAAASLDSIVDLYVAYFNRVPEASGLIYWIDQFAGGKTLEQIAVEFYAAGIVNSATTGYTAGMAINDFTTILYANVLGRTGATAPDAGELSYWANEVSTGAVTREGMAARFLLNARDFYDNAEFGFVPRLLDQKIAFGKQHAITYGVDYADPATSIQTTVNLAAAVTSTSTDAAVTLMGLAADDFLA